ncbi:MAG: hypothetical protein CMO26_17275 [Thiotrichales bacterium]|nr:hypothetical protein [Thiotrichales bacterium]
MLTLLKRPDIHQNHAQSATSLGREGNRVYAAGIDSEPDTRRSDETQPSYSGRIQFLRSEQIVNANYSLGTVRYVQDEDTANSTERPSTSSATSPDLFISRSDARAQIARLRQRQD